MREQIDLTDPDRFSNGVPYHWFAWMRANEPVYWQEESDGPGFWSITRYEDVKAISRSPKVFSSWKGGTNIFDVEGDRLESLRLIMLNMDPPQHTKFRRIVSKGFTPKRVAMLQHHVAELARAVVDGIAERGEAEFVDDVACRLPMETICEMMGVPESDRRHIYDLSNRLIGFDDPDFQTSMDDGGIAAAEMYGYAEELGAQRRKCPMDDLTSILVQADIDGEKLTSAEFDSFFLLMAIAGNETTRTVTAQGMRLLSENLDQRDALAADLTRIPDAVEEMLRCAPAVMSFRRTALEDTEIRGVPIKEGDKVVMWYPSANRDEEIFDRPDAFDVHREFNEHLAFGAGEHYCLGASLARLQLASIFRELLARLPDIEVSGEIRYLRSNFIDGIKQMPVRFTPRPRNQG